MIVLVLYWVIRNKFYQNVLIFVTSYIFYGWVHPWFLTLIAASTVLDYYSARFMKKYPDKKKWFLYMSLAGNLGMLCFFKYFNFFAENIQSVFALMGFQLSPFTLKIFLPVGLSFYTFQTLSYTINVYRGTLEPRKNFIDIAAFVSFFPVLVAGPIERASNLLPQFEKERKFALSFINIAIPLLLRGYLKKLVIADNVSIFVDKVYMLQNPSTFLLIAATLAFAVQIYTDFSAYTDIARGSAILFGFRLMENFKSPYSAISPSDFWRRWHISFSTWIRDYLYIPLGGSKVKTTLGFFLVCVATMGISGLWHGASWHFVIWGIYHGLLVFAYHKLGMGGKWQPKGVIKRFIAWFIMFTFTIFGWMLFRTPNMEWLFEALKPQPYQIEMSVAAFQIIALTAFFSFPLFLIKLMDKYAPKNQYVHAIVYGFIFTLILIFFQDAGQDFIYFQF